MTITSIGGQAVGRPELTKAIESIAAKAKKQLDETGTLVGFSADYKNESGDGVIKLSISAIGAALYDKSAGKDDVLLAFTLDAANGLGNSGGSGSSLTIKGDKDIEDFAKNQESTTDQLPFAQGWDGDPDEIEAAFGDGQTATASSLSVSLSVASTTTSTVDAKAKGSSSKVEALEHKQEDSERLIAALTDYLNGLKDSSKQKSVAEVDSDMPVSKKLLERLDVSV